MTQKQPLLWLNVIILTLTPLAAAIAVPLYAWKVGFDSYEWLLFGVFMILTGLSITAGYHRLWSHKTYKANFFVRLFWAIWGACSLQNSIVNWSTDHRDHHRFVDDNENDPYSAGLGFWHAHVGWVIRKGKDRNYDNVKDLMRDPIVRWQHKHYLALAIITNAVVPLLLGYFHGKLWGVFLLAGILRIVLNHHFTFFINSAAHFWGNRPYSTDNSARDNTLMALFTYGEGYHNYHHRFQYDYRNGIKWWHFDPSKWLIKSFSWVGLTSHLKSPSKIQIEKARLTVQFQAAMARLEQSPEAEDMRVYLEKRYQQCLVSLNEWARVKREWYQCKKKAFRAKLDHVELRSRYLELKYTMKSQRSQWRMLLAELAVT